MDLETLGHAAATYQRNPRLIGVGIRAVQRERARAASEPIPVAAVPELRLNDVAYFSVDDVAAAVAWLSAYEAEEAASKAREAAHE